MEQGFGVHLCPCWRLVRRLARGRQYNARVFWGDPVGVLRPRGVMMSDPIQKEVLVLLDEVLQAITSAFTSFCSRNSTIWAVKVSMVARDFTP